MASRFAGVLLTVAAVIAVVAFIAARASDSGCAARRFAAQVLLTKIADAEKGVRKEHKRYDDLPFCTPGASKACFGSVIVVDIAKLEPSPYSFYARTTPTGFIAVAVGTSGASLGDVLTLDETGATGATRGFCGRW
jgi:hypothetical protein